MAKKDSPKKEKTKTTYQGGDIHVGGSVSGKNNVIGNNNVVHNYITIVEKNTKPNDPDYWNLKHPYPMPPNFTGRIAERAMLTHWLDGDSENRLFILRALGGFGKSALAWQWLTHDVNPKKWKKVVFWSFYEGDASFDHFVEETLKYLNREVPQGKRDQVDSLLHAMQADKILLIMDGFERALRAYSSMNAAYQGDEEPKLDDNQLDCTDLNAEIFLRSICSLPKIQSKVLITTRLTPRAIKSRGEFMVGCRETELTAMQKADAVEFFHKQGIQGNRVEIESACELYGYHPLSLRLLAGRILKDFQNPGDVSVAQKLKIGGDIIQQKHHVLEVSYNSLPEQEKKLIGTIACFRSPVEYQILQSIAEKNATLDTDLNDLIERGLLHRTTRLISNHPISIFDLHPIVRRYAYDRLTATHRTNAHEKLVNYFETVPKPEKIEKLEDLTPVIELYHHMVGAGKLDGAIILFQKYLADPLHFQFGAYQLQIELLAALFLEGQEKLPRLKTEAWQGWATTVLANAYSLSGQPYRSVSLFEMSIRFDEKHNNKNNLAVNYGNLASMAQIPIGALSAAERNLRRRIDLSQEISDERSKAIAHRELGRILSTLGDWKLAEQEARMAIEMFKTQNNPQSGGYAWAYFALYYLLLSRSDYQSKSANINLAIVCASRALEYAEETARTLYPHPRDYIRAYWLLGAANRINNKLSIAEENLSKALNLCRQINVIETEAEILLDVAKLRYAQGDFKDALEKASEALLITERSGYVLQGADVNLFLAQYAMEQEKDKVKAKEYAEEALRLAYCDGGEYKYKVAYEEAERMLEKLK